MFKSGIGEQNLSFDNNEKGNLILIIKFYLADLPGGKILLFSEGTVERCLSL